MAGKYITAAAAALALACASSAKAESWLQFEAGVGAAHYEDAGDGIWFNQGLSHDLHLSAPAWRLGVQLNAVDYHPGSYLPGIAFHALYLNFGQASMRSLAAPDYDPNVYNNVNGGYYDAKAHSCVKECGPLRNFVSGGRMQAFALTVEPFWTHNNWRWGIEAGPMLFRSTWDASATSLTATPYTGPAGSVETFHRTPTWEVGALLGASVGYGPISLRYNYAYAKTRKVSGTNVPPGFSAAHMLTFNLTY